MNDGPSEIPSSDPAAQCDALLEPDLAAIVQAWPDLPVALKAGILAMVKAARG